MKKLEFTWEDFGYIDGNRDADLLSCEKATTDAQAKFDEWYKENIENALYNLECDEQCQCCNNNAAVVADIKEIK